MFLVLNLFLPFCSTWLQTASSSWDSKVTLFTFFYSSLFPFPSFFVVAMAVMLVMVFHHISECLRPSLMDSNRGRVLQLKLNRLRLVGEDRIDPCAGVSLVFFRKNECSNSELAKSRASLPSALTTEVSILPSAMRVSATFTRPQIIASCSAVLCPISTAFTFAPSLIRS